MYVSPTVRWFCSSVIFRPVFVQINLLQLFFTTKSHFQAHSTIEMFKLSSYGVRNAEGLFSQEKKEAFLLVPKYCEENDGKRITVTEKYLEAAGSM